MITIMNDALSPNLFTKALVTGVPISFALKHGGYRVGVVIQSLKALGPIRSSGVTEFVFAGVITDSGGTYDAPLDSYVKGRFDCEFHSGEMEIFPDSGNLPKI